MKNDHRQKTHQKKTIQNHSFGPIYFQTPGIYLKGPGIGIPCFEGLFAGRLHIGGRRAQGEGCRGDGRGGNHLGEWDDLPSGYDVHSSPWKIHPFLRTVKPSISIRAIEILWLCNK